MGETTILEGFGKRIFLAIGNTDDQYIGKDLALRSFESFLMHYLREEGFYNILFFNSREFKGQYALDEESAKRLFKTNQPTAGTGENTGAGKTTETGRKKRPRERRKQADHTAQSASEKPQDLEQQKQEEWKSLVYGYSHSVNMDNFREKVFRQLSDVSHRNAVIFSNVDALLENAQEFEKIFDENTRIPDSKGIVICIAHDHTEKEFYDILNGRYPFFAKYFTDGNGSFNSSNVLRLTNPGQDEIERLLEHMRIVGVRKENLFGGGKVQRLRYPVSDLKELAGLLRFYAVDGKKEGYIMLREIRERLEAYMEKENQEVVSFDKDSISRIYGETKTIPKTAMEELHRRGWEPVYEAMDKLFVDNQSRKEEKKNTAATDQAASDSGSICICDRMIQKSAHVSLVDIPHFLLLGPPGTGKTTIAKLIGRALYEAGMLESGHTVERRAGSLISQHVGESAHFTEDAIKEAKGGVLFIDEAYALVANANGHTGHERDFGQAVVDTLVAYTERQEQKEWPFCLILAGYQDDVNDVLKMNPGLPGRIPEENRLVLKTYSADHLADIFTEHLEQANYEIPEDIFQALPAYFEELKASKLENLFQNAREAVNTAEMVIRNCNYRQAGRMIIRKDFGKKARFLQVNNENLEEEIAQMEREIQEVLDTRIGNQGLKEVIKELKEKVFHNMIYPSRRTEIEPGYYFFEGAPGTGKSTSVEIFAKCLEILGIMETDEIEVKDAGDLIAGYEGQTAIKTKELLEKSSEKVLLIDEAYALDPNANHSGGGYKKESVDGIVAFLDKKENRRHCCIVFAGYEAEMERMKKGSNSGWSSRITETILFPSYSGQECADIMDSMAIERKYELQDDVKAYYTELFDRLKTEEGFSNGRTVRNVLDDMEAKAISRNLRERYPQDDPRLGLLTMAEALSEDEVRKCF